MSSAKDLFLKIKPKIEPVSDREGNIREGIYVRVMTGAARFSLEKKFKNIDEESSQVNALVETTLATACDVDGNLAFHDEDKSEIELMPADLLQDIFDLGLKINRMLGTEDADEVKSSSETQS